MTSSAKIFLISLFILCLTSGAVIEVGQPNENSANGRANQGPN